MTDAQRLAADPRWQGEPGRLEVWYATLSDPVTHAALWVHYETVAPTADTGRSPYGHGWVTWFPAEGSPRTSRFGPVPVSPSPASGWGPRFAGGYPQGSVWFGAGGARAEWEALSGRAGELDWDLGWADAAGPLWTFPKAAWQRQLLPGAQVVIAPTAQFSGSVTVGGEAHRVDRWRGAVAHIYGHGNAKRWGWIHAGLGDGDVLEVVTAVSRRPGLNKLKPLAFVRFRLDGRDWPASPMSPRMRTTLGLPLWELTGRIGRRDVLIRVDQPADRCVSLGYTDPDGAAAVCTNTEQANVDVEISRGGLVERRWSLHGTGHAEVGLRGPDAPCARL